jgi:hypothetical protein
MGCRVGVRPEMITIWAAREKVGLLE